MENQPTALDKAVKVSIIARGIDNRFINCILLSILYSTKRQGKI